MIVLRRSALSGASALNSLRSTRTAALRVSGRRYASTHGAAQQARGDLPWLIGSVGVTIPGVWYFLQSTPHEHGKPGEHDEKNQHEAQKANKVSDAEGVSENEGKTLPEQQGKDNEMEKDNNQPEGEEATKDEAHMVDTPDNKGDPEGVGFKGPTKQSPDKKMDDTREHIPDAKGGAKKRINSGYGQPLGKDENNEERSDDEAGNVSDKDKALSAKKPGGQGSISGKQQGLSNTDTKHPSAADVSGDKSTKGEGTVETAKVKGTVKPDRPDATNKEKRDTDNA